jgi:formylglycine-generating enzyme required for sulfatase activity
MHRFVTSQLLISAIFLIALRPASANFIVTVPVVPVGSPGNANDPATGNLFGGVPYAYAIGTQDVTNSQYASFLNTKDPTGANTLGLWNSNMANATFGGISFNSGNPAGSMYVLTPGRENHPVNYVTWYDAIRFANWLNNGQGNGNTETGAYTLLGGTPTPSNGMSIVRNPGATWFLPSESEWYKAAYYDPGMGTYFQFPTSNDTAPTAEIPPGGSNSANYNNAVGDLTDVGAYTGTSSPFGAFDMGGDVFQWNEALISGARGVRGGSFSLGSLYMESSTRSHGIPTIPQFNIGFRVATVPEPSSLSLCGLSAIGLLGYALRRHRAAWLFGNCH